MQICPSFNKSLKKNLHNIVDITERAGRAIKGKERQNLTCMTIEYLSYYPPYFINNEGPALTRYLTPETRVIIMVNHNIATIPSLISSKH